MISPSRQAGTVNNTWLNASHTVFKWALEHGYIPSNPFAVRERLKCNICIFEPRVKLTHFVSQSFGDWRIAVFNLSTLVPIATREKGVPRPGASCRQGR
jgi:hypothetical protein